MHTISVVAATLLTFTLGCGTGEEEDASPRPEPTPAVTPAPPPAPAAPERADAGATYACIDGDAAAGATHYATFCSTCHGPSGDGQGPAAAALDPKPAKHTDGTGMNALSNDHLFKVVKHGGAAVGKSPLMMPWGGVLNDAQIWDVVAFVRSLAEPSYRCP